MRRADVFEHCPVIWESSWVIAWIVLAIVAGAMAEHAVSRRESHGVIITCLIGVAGALLGGRPITEFLHGLRGFFHLSTRITALAGSAVLLAAVYPLEGQRGDRRSLRRSAGAVLAAQRGTERGDEGSEPPASGQPAPP